MRHITSSIAVMPLLQRFWAIDYHILCSVVPRLSMVACNWRIIKPVTALVRT